MARRNRIKQHITKNIYKVDNSLEKLVMSEIKEANQKLDSLSRHYKKGSWASKKLMQRLGADTLKAWDFKRGKIKVPKSLNKTKLTAINKAIKMFNSSQTSSHKGIKAVSKATKISIKKSLALDKEIDDSDVEDFYNMLGDGDFDYFASKIGASTVWDLIQDAIEYNQTEKEFADILLDTAMLSNDLDTIERANRLYNKYVA